MNHNIAVYPGTFDPITNGHIDILQKATTMFDQVILAVASFTGKDTLFNVEERKVLCQQAVAHLPNVKVMSYDSLSVQFCRKVGAKFMIRGMRAVSDFEYELQLALMNKKMDTEIETVFLIPHIKFLYLSSSMIRSILKLDGELEGFIPQCVETALKQKFKVKG